MSGTVDTKTVEMRFDNKNFESNVKQSMSTLDKLKQKLKLDGASKGLEEVEKKSKKLDFKDLDRSIDNIGRKFSALETIATGVFLRIGMKAADAGIKLLKSFTVDQVSSGWDRLEKKTTAVQVIMSSLKDDASKFTDEFSKMEYVEQWMEKLSWFADETSYSLPALTDGIGKLTSKGVGLESAVTAVEGMSLWAASAGQNAQTAARMYDQLSQAVGRGYMATQDWMSVESAQMDTAEFKELVIQLAEEANVIKKGEVTLENFRTTLNKKWLSSDIQIKAYEKYGEAVDYVVGKQRELEAAGIDKTANEIMQMIEKSTDEMDQAMANSLAFKAFKRGQEAKTFSEVLEATNTAVATGWMNIFETITGNYLEQRGIWTDLSNDLYHVFVDPLNNITEILELWNVGFSSGPLTELQKAFDQGSLENLDSGFKYVSRSAAEAAVESTKFGDDVYYTIEKLDDGSEQIVRKIKNVSGGYDRWVKKIYEDDRELLSGRELLIEGFRNLLQTFLLGWEEEVGDEVVEHLSVLDALKQAFLEVFFPDIARDPEGGKKSIAEHLVDLTKKFKEFTEKLKPLGDKLKNIFKGFFSIVKIAGKFISALIKPFKGLFSKIFGEVPDGILGFADSIATWIEKFDKFLEENKIFENISEGIATALDAIARGIDWLSIAISGLSFKELIDSFDIKEKIEEVITFFSGLVEQIKQVETGDLPDQLTPIQTFWLRLKNIWAGIKTILESVIKKLKNFWKKIKEVWNDAKPAVTAAIDALMGLFEKITTFISGLFTNTSESGEEGTSFLKTFWDGLKSFFESLTEFHDKNASKIDGTTSWIGKKLSEFRDFIAEIKKNHDLGDLIGLLAQIAIAFAMIYGIVRVVQIITSIGEFAENVSDILWGVYRIERSAKRYIDTLAIKNLGKTLLMIAGSLALVAVAFSIMSSLKFENGHNMWEIAGVFGAFMVLAGALVILTKKLAPMMDSFEIWALGSYIKKLASSLVLVAAAFAIMGSIKYEVNSMWSIAGVFGAFIVLAGALLVLKEKLAFLTNDLEVKALGKYVRNLAIALVLVAAAFAIMSGLKFKNNSMWSIAGLFGAFIAVAAGMIILLKYTNKNPIDSEEILAIGKYVLSVAAALVLVATAFAIMSGLKFETNSIWSIAGVFGAFIAITVGIPLIYSLINKYQMDSSALKELGKYVLAVAGALVLVAAAFAIMSGLKFKTNSMWSIAGVFGAFIALSAGMIVLIKMISKNGLNSTAISALGNYILSVGAALVLVAAAFAIMSGLKFEHGYNMEQIGAVFGLFIALSVGMIMLMKMVDKNSIDSAALLALGVYIESVAFALILVTAAFAIFSHTEFKHESMWSIAGVFGAFIALTGIVATAVLYALKKVDNPLKAQGAFTGMAIFLAAAAASLVIVAAAFAIMSALKFDKNSMWSIAGVFGIFLALSAGIAIAAVELTKNMNIGQALQVMFWLAVFINAAAVSLVIVSAAFAIMSSLSFNENSMWSIAGLFGAFLVVTGAVAILAGKLITDANSWIGIIAVAGVLLSAAIAIGIVALSFGYLADKLSLDQMNKCVEILTVFGLIVGILAGIGLIAGEIGPWGLLGLAAMAGLILTAGLSCLIAGVGISIAAKALDKLFQTVSAKGSTFSVKIKEISDALLVIIGDIANNVKNIAIIAGLIALLGIACSIAAPGVILLVAPIVLLIAVAAYLVDSVSRVINAITNFIDLLCETDPSKTDSFRKNLESLLDAIIELAPKAETAAEKVATALAAGLEAGAQPLARAGIKIALLTIIGIWEGLALLTDPLIKSFIDWINSLADSIRNNSDAMAEAGANLSEAVFEGLLAGLQKRADVLGWGKVVEGIQGWREKLREKFGIGGDEPVDLKIDTAVGTITKAVSGTEVPDRFATRAKSRERANSAETAGKEDGEAYVDGFTEATSSSSDSGGLLGMLFGGRDSGLTGVTSLFGSAGTESGTAFMGNFNSMLNLDTMTNEDGSLNIEALVSAFGSSGTESGNELMSAFTSTMSQSSDQAKTAGEEVAQSTSEPFQEIVNNATTWGQDLVTNFADGMVGKADLTEEAATKIGSVIHAILGFSEPKKGPLSDFHTYAPDMIKLWCSGIYDNLGLIDDSSVAMGNRINDGFGTALDYVSNLIDGGMTDELTIRPIMDLSEIQNGVNKLDSMLSNDSYSLSGTADISSYAARDMSTFGVKNEPAQSTQPVSSSDTFNNTFNITNSDPDAVADRVSRILQQQVVRKQAVWAR